MCSGLIRRLVVVMLSMALVIGVSAHYVQTTEMGLKTTVAASSHMPMPGKYSGCVGDKKATGAFCSAFCGSPLALTSMADVFDSVSIDIVEPSLEPAATGLGFSPDPYPPRPAILG